MILQAVQQVPIDVHDITFKTTDVVEIIVFTAALCGIYFYVKYQLKAIKTMLVAHMTSTENDLRSVHSRINDTRSNHDELEKEMTHKHEEILNTMHAMEIKIIEKISEIKNKN